MAISIQHTDWAGGAVYEYKPGRSNGLPGNDVIQ